MFEYKQKRRQYDCKKALVAFVLILLMASSIAFVALPTASAHTPAWVIPTYAYLVVSPNPIGVGQPVYVVMWLHGAPPTAAGDAGDRWRGFKVQITTPTGKVVTKGPINSDPTGSNYLTYTPTEGGTYTFLFTYPGQVLTLVNPNNGKVVSRTDPTLTRFGGGAFENDTFLASNATTTLTVLDHDIAKIPDYPMPTSYWAHPIEGENSNWAAVASNWLAGAYLGWVNPNQQNIWNKDGIGPRTAHVMWTRPIEFGGIVGETTQVPDIGYYSGGSYEGRFTSSMIMNGYLFYQEPLGHSNNGGGYTAVDLRTGQVAWHRDDIGAIVTAGTSGTSTTTSTVQTAGPTFGQLYNYESPNQHGVVSGILWQTSIMGSGANAYTVWQGFDAFTGKWVFNETNVPYTGQPGTVNQNVFEAYTDKGEIVRYVLNYNPTTRNGWLGLWNNTAEQQGLHAGLGTVSEAWQWRPNNKVVNMSKAYSWNSTIGDLSGLSLPTIVSVIPGDRVIGTSCSLAWLGGVLTQTPNPMTMWALNINASNGAIGSTLWIKNISAPSGFITPYFGPVDPATHIWTLTYIETFEWLGYSTDTGDLVWGPIKGAENDFSYYGSGRGGGQLGFLAYGNLYTQGFGGEICCFRMTDGKLMWRYNNTNSGDETVWGNYPIFIMAITDHKIYAFNNEHSPNYPLYKGEKVYCISADDGAELWKMLGWSGQTGGPGTSTGILADGYLVYYNYYDNQIYSVGKGPSSVTIDAPSTSVSKGQSMVIRGTVTDISQGAKNLMSSGKFNIVPAMSDAFQAEWMQYLYMQKPMPTNATGVKVTLFATGPDGQTNQIGEPVSDRNGMYYLKWAPDQVGTYTVSAVFQGSDSYWSSSASTAIGVDPAGAAPTAAPTTEAPATTAPATTTAAPGPGNPTMTYLYVAIAAVIIVVVIVAAAVMLRKRK
jgi:hypothetical protein